MYGSITSNTLGYLAGFKKTVRWLTIDFSLINELVSFIIDFGSDIYNFPNSIDYRVIIAEGVFAEYCYDRDGKTTLLLHLTTFGI